MSRMFYLAAPQVPVRLEGELKPEFTLFFNVKSRKALEILLRILGKNRISGKRYRRRSGINFAISFLGSFFFSVLFNFGNYWLQSIVFLALTVLIYLIIDYPFSLLYLKGVEVLSHDPFKKKAKVVRIERIRKTTEKAE
ncbi:hypothetical protein [Thermococcus sp. Bubb.Bath]|uniref:hypothetical protein n=1 Tax=Thermococcus sp. Bubb.Bath TaxID=1638242 RepID=UPI001439388D|nr:hypothetical protein [Thermococcus sp. Bubb.Bath]NJF24376.1 hypothetical protein [Thermococcus sp. Bubb.Bath]